MAKGFVAERIWRALKRKPGMTCSELTEIVRSRGCSQALARLRVQGYAANNGARCTRLIRWYAVGKVAPVDGRGIQPGSQKHYLTREIALERLRLAHAARGRPNVVVPRPTKPQLGELERHWPMP